jgi:Fuc2NAc and GlcNAc transferase
MNLLIVLIIVAAVSLLMTVALRKYALSKKLIDIPNERSSHTIPTPRGGGVAIVVVYLLTLPFLSLNGILHGSDVASMFGAGVLVAVIGFIDDHGHIAARWRLVGHFLAAGWALYFLGGLPAIDILGVTTQLGLVGDGIAVIYLVWLLNLYNFMDGIDGVAGIEALTTCIGGSLVYIVAGHSQMVWAPMILGGAVVGFLWWNFPPARIFMGDAGSGFLGITLGILSLEAMRVNSDFLWCWLILLGVFVVDASLTLIRRLMRGDKVYEAHRTHAYQFASRLYGKHYPVTLAVLVINLIWLMPLSVAVALGMIDGFLGVCVAYTPLVLLAVRYNAGKRED